MNPTTNKPLRILQQNLNKSGHTQLDLLNDPFIADYDILALQEPHLTFLGLTTSTPNWHVVYPTAHGTDGEGQTHSVILVNSRLSTGSWTAIPVRYSDITAISVHSDDATLHLFNLYVDGDHDTALHAASRSVLNTLAGDAATPQHLVWLGDFNRHHLSWDNATNIQLFNTGNLRRAEHLINILDSHDLLQVLLQGVPTLEASHTKNYTRPDNIFCMPDILERLRICTVLHDKCPTNADHFPIQTVFNLPTTAATQRPRRDF